MSRRTAVLLVLAALVPPAVALALGAGQRPATATAPGLRGAALPAGLAGAPAPAIDLRDARGGRRGTADVRGRPYLVTFVYAGCRDVCPAIAATIGMALAELGRRDVGVLAVSTDPRGDTPSAARAFLRRHRLPATFHYLLGTGAELRRVWDDWMVGGGRDHSVAIWVVDARGRLRALYHDELPTSADLAHDLGVLAGETSAL